MNKKNISAEEFDRRFDAGEDISKYVDWEAARPLNEESKRVNVDFPVWMLKALDREASRLGISRQAVIKVMVDNQLQHLHHDC